NLNTIHSLTMDDGRVATGNGTLIMNGNVTGSGQISGKLALGAVQRTFTVGTIGTNNTLIVSATITGTAGFLKNGPGTLRLARDSQYTGVTTVAAGTLEVTTPQALGVPGQFISGTTEGSNTDHGTRVQAGATIAVVGSITVPETLILEDATLESRASDAPRWNGPMSVFGTPTTA